MAKADASGLKWVTLFDNMQEGSKPDGPLAKKGKKTTNLHLIENDDMGTIGAGDVNAKVSKGDDKRLSVERIYQKKTQLEHILLRPDTYIGSVESVTQSMWVMDEDGTRMVQRDISFVPGLYKIFDEIIVNAADNKVRDPEMNSIKIDIDPENNKIKIWNNGKGIPVVEHKTEKMYVPTMIFGHLLTSSNYDDSEQKVTGGRNGYGAKLCNIFSTKFIVETSSGDYRKAFKQTWTDNMTKTKDPTITESKEHDFTCVTFHPDLSKFGMTVLDRDIVALFTRRAYDVAASTRGVKVFLNGKKIPVKNFRDYMDLYLKDKTDEAGQPLKVVYEHVNPRWEVGVALSDSGFQQVSFVNSIATTKGGRHVDYVADQCVTKLLEVIKKKNKDGINIRPFQVKSHLWVFVNCLIENPTFDSQTKENMTKQAKSFGSKCQLSDKFILQVNKCGIVESVLSWMKFKAQAQLNQKCHASKHSKLKGIPKLDDANDAGTRNSERCTLILTEGDSAKSLAVAGLGVIGRDHYGVFPLRGKLLNVREATHKQIMDNAEINNIIKILGLHFKETYDTAEKLRTLRYGKLMIMTDQDQDGSHIKGLLINFVHHFWPNLLQHNFVEEFITPIVKVFKGKTELSFFSLPEFEEWKRTTDNWHTWKVKYYKGLGTSTSKEAKDYFQDMVRHRIPFRYGGLDDDASINLAFSKKKIEERKEWLTNYMEERKRRAEMGLPELYLYGKDTRQITYSEFINRELILFSNMDLVRSIPSLMDGLKPGQRKVIFTCIKRNLTQKELKVAQLAGSVAEQSAYHHGEVSLMSTIINLAQNFVGSNNLNLLQPLGQFGTRLHGGKDAASPRYIFTMLSPLARHVFNPKDDGLLRHLFDDNQRIEPEWYCPIIPMVLVNGADGIGTGWSTKIPNYDIREIIANLKRMLDGLDPLPMVPAFKNFRGSIQELGDNRYVMNGEVSILDDRTVEITELPIRCWTQNYKEEVLEPMLHGTEKTPSIISDYKEYHTDTTVKFVVKMAPEKLAQAEESGLHKVFKLQTSLSTASMVLFDHKGCIRHFHRVEEILREFFDVRLDYYHRRKHYLEGMLSAETLKLDNIARFILEKIEGTIVIENKPKREIIQMLVRRGYDSDPVKAWKETQNKEKDLAEGDDEDDNASTASGDSSGPDFNYILNLPLWSLTKERKDELLKQRDAKRCELVELQKKTPSDLWTDDLEQFLLLLDEVEQQEREEAAGEAVKPGKLGKVGKLKPKKALVDTQPSPIGRRIVPRIDSAMKVKAEKDAARKFKARVKKELKQEFDGAEGIDDDGPAKEEDGEPLSLAQRLNLNAAKPKPKQQRKPAGTGAGAGPGPGPGPGAGAGAGLGAGRARGRGRGTGSPGKAKKPGKKRKPWSDSDGSAGEISDISDSDMGDSFVAPARDRGPRRAAAGKAKYTFDDDVENEDHVSSGSDNDLQPLPPQADSSAEPPPVSSDVDSSPIKPMPKRKVDVLSDSDKDSSIASISDDDDDDDNMFKPMSKAPITKAVAKLAPKAALTQETTSKDLPPSHVAPSQAPASSKPVMTMDFTDSDDGFSLDTKTLPKEDDADDLFVPKPDSKLAAKKPTAPKPAAKRQKKDSGESKPRKPKAKRGKNSDSEGSSDFFPKKKKGPAKKKPKDSEGEDDFGGSGDMDFSAVPRRGATTGRAKAPVKYNFGDSDDDFDDF
ncbi:DNA topoisomerase 2-alpha-like isoform X3 [Pomacea canaliculata]|uniref:DNA topoisomerase 2-alpha-like isoform X3 n=1 Tax=Pomacea canaliculata TaxID=400727 RepID=UPI000D73101A|nr:DNA topoisomerase 2-alpha-like isoform X3 [Pomacea canaliculata]